MQCERWGHYNCDLITNISEDEADRLANDGFFCFDCKPKFNHKCANQFIAETNCLSPGSEGNGKCGGLDGKGVIFDVVVVEIQSPQPVVPPPKRGVLEEGVYLTDFGLSLMRKMRIKPPVPVRQRRPPLQKPISINEIKKYVISVFVSHIL